MMSYFQKCCIKRRELRAIEHESEEVPAERVQGDDGRGVQETGVEEEDAGASGRGATETGATGELRQQVLQMWTAGPLGQEL